MSSDDLRVARRMKDFLDKHASPREATVNEIAEGIEADPEQVAEILDTHVVDEDGKIAHAGAGSGGGWVPPEPEQEAEPEG